ncbi:MAG: type II toxin-antitoxin system RelE/ParE family toxin [Sphingobacteriaceae bacterium]|nr:type II toxin-antitoxin system RelE/ParE family toxin [Cytophagaceae bacterium]
MSVRFEVIYLKAANQFLTELAPKVRAKVLRNIDVAKLRNDPALLKKLTGEIWEFRTEYEGIQYRLLAFWDKTEATETLVIATHGFVKKQDKVPKNEIEKAERIRHLYFANS